jgi:cholesterol transport system auxiliary component
MRQLKSVTRRGVGRLSLGAVMALALAGCATAPRQAFDLATVSGPARVGHAGGPALGVREPLATPPTGGDRIVVREVDGSVAILPEVQWTARLTRLLQDRLVESLQRAGVSASPVSVGTRSLATDVRRFEIDIARNVAVVEIAARLVDVNTGAAQAAQSFTAEAPAPDHTGAAAALALTQAGGDALSRIAGWARGRL